MLMRSQKPQSSYTPAGTRVSSMRGSGLIWSRASLAHFAVEDNEEGPEAGRYRVHIFANPASETEGRVFYCRIHKNTMGKPKE